MTLRLAVFASGGGSNLQALLDRFAHDAHVQVALVVSDRGGSGALARASAAGVDAVHVPANGRAMEDIGEDTLRALDDRRIDMVALAGYLRLVPHTVVGRFRGRILNVHPALLPAFGGAGMYGRRVHEAVIAAGCSVSGATVHYVDERYDEGRIIAQWPVPVLSDDSAESLAARVLRVEHRLYPAVVSALARSLSRGARAAAGTHAAEAASAAGTGSTAGTGPAFRTHNAVAAERSAGNAAAALAFRLGDDLPSEEDIISIARI